VFQIIKAWFYRYFSDPEAVLLFFLLLFGFGLVIFMGGVLTPVLASIVIAYLLQWVVGQLERCKIPRLMAVWIVFLGFLGLFLASFFLLLPLLWKQLAALFNELPHMIVQAQNAMDLLAKKFPEYFSADQIQTLVSSFVGDIQNWGKVAVTASLSSISSLIVWLVYLVLVPLLIFFFLKDRNVILTWMSSFLPDKRGVLSQVSGEVNIQIGNYIRGKVMEIVIVGIVTYLVLEGFGLQYAALLSFLVGVSVLIPYVGAVVATIPVVLVGYLQWGWSSQFGYAIGTYLIVQGLDANILVPLLFSEAVNLHPIAIVVATLVFGSFWGFWGVFFAIPLATLIKAVLYAWPRRELKVKGT